MRSQGTCWSSGRPCVYNCRVFAKLQHILDSVVHHVTSSMLHLFDAAGVCWLSQCTALLRAVDIQLGEVLALSYRH